MLAALAGPDAHTFALGAYAGIGTAFGVGFYVLPDPHSAQASWVENTLAAILVACFWIVFIPLAIIDHL